MRSLRARLLVSALVGTSLTFATVGVGVYAVARNRMRADLDASLVSLARTSVAAAVAELSWGRLDEEEPTPRFTLDGLCFSPWLERQDPRTGSYASPQQLWDRLSLVRRDARSVRTYGMGGGLHAAPEMIHLLGLEVVAGAWVGTDPDEIEAELDALVGAALEGHVDVAVIGNEVLSRGDLDPAQLIVLLERARAALPPEIPVTTAEPWSVWIENPGLVEAVDQLFVNYHPYWHGVPVEEAVGIVACWHAQVLDIALGKPVVVAETGWPSGGSSFGAAQPSGEDAGRYVRDFVAWARLNGVRFHYFSAFDEPWKVEDEGDPGPHWGYREADGRLKPGLRPVFDGPLSPPMPPSLDFTFPEAEVGAALRGRAYGVGVFKNRLAVYLHTADGWWTKTVSGQPVTDLDCDGSFEVELFATPQELEADAVLVAVVPDDFVPPVLSGAADLPRALLGRAVTHREARR